MAAADDTGGAGADVERYEQLRRSAISGEPSGWRLGMALLQQRGMAAWARACDPLPPSPPADRHVGAPVGGDEVVGLLAQMAMACLRGG